MTDVHVVGLGIVGVDQLTREAERALRAANEVLFVDRGVATRALLESLCPQVTDLTTAYAERGQRVDAYRWMAARVVAAALEHPPVAFALHGHPLVFTYPPFLIRDLGRALGLEVAFQPGVSALDAILAELGVDPSPAGLQLYEATDLLLRARPLQDDVPLLLWQIGTVESCLHTARRSRPERFHKLRDHLLRFYPPTHVARAVYCSPHPLMRSVVHDVAIGELPGLAAELHAGYSLWVPARRQRPIADLELLEQLEDPEHLARLTR